MQLGLKNGGTDCWEALKENQLADLIIDLAVAFWFCCKVVLMRAVILINVAEM